MRAIAGHLLRMLPYMAAALPLLAVWRFLAVKRLNRRGDATTVWHEAGLLVFAMYLAGLAPQAFAPVSGGAGLSYNLVLFDVFRHGGGYLPINLIGNVAVFVPVGFFVPLLWRGGTLRRALLAGACASLLLELTQLPLGRCADVDDLWTNTLGALVGYGLYRLLRVLSPPFTERCRTRRRAETPLERN